MSEIVASAQVLPSSRVSLTIPLLVPIQIVPRAIVDGEIDSIAPTGCGRAVSPCARPASTGSPPFGTLRSGLNFVQCTPPSVVAMRY